MVYGLFCDRGLILIDRMRKGMEKVIGRLKNVEGFEKVKFIILYGLAAKERMTEGSDIDLCVYYEGDLEEMSNFRLRALAELFDDVYDLQIFQQLPLYIRIEVLGGEILYCRDKRFLYETAIKTIKDFEGFKRKFYDYIGMEEIT